MKRANIRVETGKPLEFLDVVDTDAPITEGLAQAKGIGEALRAYLTAARELLTSRYAVFADIAPTHLRMPCDIFVIRCVDGFFVRYDRTEGEPKNRAADSEQTLTDLPITFSDKVLRFGDAPIGDSPADVPSISLETLEPTGMVTDTRTIHLVIRANTHLPEGFEVPKPPARPPCLVSLQNEVTFHLHGVLGPAADGCADDDRAKVQHFIAAQRAQLPVGWQAIETYPPLSDEHWRPEHAALWAELDILACVARRNLHDSRLHALDGHAVARGKYAALFDEFERLLHGPEEPVHQFLKQHPELLSPTHEKVWSKLRFGDRISDFVFRVPHNDYELVEIEAPVRLLFRKDGQQREELTHAMNQIADWVQYIEDNKAQVENELGLVGISTNPRSLIVIGRSECLTDDNRRKLATLANQISKLRILTYDDVLEAARRNLERIFGLLQVVPGENVEVYFFNPP